MLARAEAAELVLADLSGMRRGTLALYASQTIASDWLPRHLVAFRRTYPEIALRLAVGNTTDAADAVRAGQAELGFVEGALDDPTLASTTIARDQLVLVVAPNHHFAGRPPSHPKTSPGRLGAARGWIGNPLGLRGGAHEAGLAPAQLRVTLELPSNEAVRAAVEAGGGATVLSETVVAAAIRAGTLCGRRSSCQADPSGCCATRSATAVGPPTRCSNSSQRRIPDERACETRAPPDDPRVRLAKDRTRRRPGRLALPAGGAGGLAAEGAVADADRLILRRRVAGPGDPGATRPCRDPDDAAPPHRRDRGPADRDLGPRGHRPAPGVRSSGDGHPHPVPGGAEVALVVPGVVGSGRLGLAGGIPGPHREFVLASGQLALDLPERPGVGRVGIALDPGLRPAAAAIRRDVDPATARSLAMA